VGKRGVCAFQERGKSRSWFWGFSSFVISTASWRMPGSDGLPGICETCCRWMQKTAPAPRSRWIQNRTSVLDHLKNQSLDGYLSQRWGFMRITDHLSAQNPEVVDMFPDGFFFFWTVRGGSDVPRRAGSRPPFSPRAPGLWASPSSFWATRQGLCNSRRCGPRRIVVG